MVRIQNKTPTILYEDKDLLVVDKPSRLVVHGDGRTEEATLADWVIQNYPDLQTVGESWENQKGEIILRPGIVHRLDRETSGVMILAKNDAMFTFLKEQFKERLIRKTYHAFVYDTLKEDEGDIDRPIGKSKSDFRRWSAQPGARGVLREAHTHWEKLGEANVQGNIYTYIALHPTTGRTHQLRVHLKAVHHPIVADTLYAPKRGNDLGFKRLALHASEIVLILPNGEQKEFTAQFPKDFQNAQSCLK